MWPGGFTDTQCKLQTPSSSGTLVYCYKTIRHHIQEDSELYHKSQQQIMVQVRTQRKNHGCDSNVPTLCPLALLTEEVQKWRSQHRELQPFVMRTEEMLLNSTVPDLMLFGTSGVIFIKFNREGWIIHTVRLSVSVIQLYSGKAQNMEASGNYQLQQHIKELMWK